VAAYQGLEDADARSAFVAVIASRLAIQSIISAAGQPLG
jgi:hypothetical protein